MFPPGGSGTGAVSQSGLSPLDVKGRRATLASAARSVNETSIPRPLPHPDVCSAFMYVVDMLSTAAPEMSAYMFEPAGNRQAPAGTPDPPPPVVPAAPLVPAWPAPDPALPGDPLVLPPHPPIPRQTKANAEASAR